jgi:hypothetical protein
MDLYSEPATSIAKQTEKQLAVAVIAECVLMPSTTVHDVMPCARLIESRCSHHADEGRATM